MLHPIGTPIIFRNVAEAGGGGTGLIVPQKKIMRGTQFIPPNMPRVMEGTPQKIGAGKFDGITLNWEDGIAENEEAKQAVRDLTTALLSQLTPELVGGTNITVRINGIYKKDTPESGDNPFFQNDVNALIQPDVLKNLDAIMLPMVGNVSHIEELSGMLDAVDPEGRVKIIALVETANGIQNLNEIARGSRVSRIDFGIEDYTATLNLPVLPPSADMISPGHERIVKQGLYDAELKAFSIAAGGAGIPWSHGPYIYFKDKRTREVDGEQVSLADIGYREVAEYVRKFGAQGMWALTPAQTPIANNVFAPTGVELKYALAVAKAMEMDGGTATIEIEGQEVFLDPAVRKTVEPTLKLAKAIAAQDEAYAGTIYEPAQQEVAQKLAAPGAKPA